MDELRLRTSTTLFYIPRQGPIMKTIVTHLLKSHPAIHSFVRNTYALLLKKKGYTHSLLGNKHGIKFVKNDEMIERLNQTLGRFKQLQFIQIGSHDGVSGDPLRTLVLSHSDWKGIFVEPVKYLFDRLKRNYSANQNYIFENLAVSTHSGKQQFYFLKEHAKSKLGDLPPWYDQLGSFNKAHILKYCNWKVDPFKLERYIEATTIECITFSDLCNKHNVKQFDLLHIDTEGHDYKILSQIDFNTIPPLVVLIEHKHLLAHEVVKTYNILHKHGYTIIADNSDLLAYRQI